jgi:hypothetical protein
MLLSGLMLLSSFTVHAQIIKPPPPPSYEEMLRTGKGVYDYYLKKWWWMSTPAQVRDRVLLEPGWNVDTGDTNPYDNQIQVVSDINSTAKDGLVMLMFSFPKEGPMQGKLYRRAYVYPASHPLVEEWNADLQKLKFDADNSVWLDPATMAKINRKYFDGRVMYLVEMYSKEGEQK